MHKIILAGYGGQGMLLCGQVLAYAAMRDGFHVTWLPSYGPEMRGGAASCSVVISERPVGSPVIKFADAIAAISQPAFDKYHSSVAEGGTIIYNSSLVKVAEDTRRSDIKYVGIDFSKLASDLGNLKVGNMIVLGSLNAVLQCVGADALHAALHYKFGEKKPELLAINKSAIDIGADALKALTD